jgi:hypothetical protein
MTYSFWSPTNTIIIDIKSVRSTSVHSLQLVYIIVRHLRIFPYILHVKGHFCFNLHIIVWFKICCNQDLSTYFNFKVTKYSIIMWWTLFFNSSKSRHPVPMLFPRGEYSLATYFLDSYNLKFGILIFRSNFVRNVNNLREIIKRLTNLLTPSIHWPCYCTVH